MENFFQGININMFFKNKNIFEKNCAIVCLEKLSLQIQYRNQSIDHFANQLTGFNMVFYERCFLTEFNCSQCN